jgi:hypothetical protein
MTFRRLLPFWVICSLSLWACGGGGGSTDGGPSPDGDLDQVASDELVSPDTGPDEVTPPVILDPDAFKILYTYQERFETCDSSEEADPLIRDSDLHIVWPDGTHGTTVTSLSLKAEGRTCEYGCFTDRDMTWVAIADKVNSSGTFDFVLGKFDANLEAKVVKGFELNDVTDFHFGGEYLFYSRFEGQEVGGPGGKFFSVKRLQLSNLENNVLLPEFPETPDRPGSTYQGHFSVDHDGSHLVLLNPTIGSQQVFHWSNGIQEELDKICPNEFGGNCASSGSQYTDTDPTAMDPLGNTVVAVFQTDNALSIHKYDLVNHQSYFNNLLAVPAGTTFETSGCFNTTETFGWVRVKKVAFTPDGKDVILLVANDCPGIEKEYTDLISLPIAAIGDGTPIEANDLTNITNNPKGDLVANLIIDGFDISPDGNAIVFTASPMYDTDGINLLQNGDLRTHQDREVYVMTIEGTMIKQLSNNLCYRALGPMAVTPWGSPPDWN